MNYPIIATVDYIDELNLANTLHSCFLLYDENLRQALLKVEEYLGEENITSITLAYAADCGSLFEVSDSVAKILLRGEGNYTAGLSVSENNQ